MRPILEVLNPPASEKVAIAYHALGIEGVAQAVDGRNVEVSGGVN